jgi:alpha-tubulin suppressor-like RCC1 family protein
LDEDDNNHKPCKAPTESTTQHYTTLQNTTLQNTTKHYIALQNTTEHYITLHNTTEHYTTLKNTTEHYKHYTTLQNAAFRAASLRTEISLFNYVAVARIRNNTIFDKFRKG